MGLLVNGQWVNQWYNTKKTGGRFERQDSQFRHSIGQGDFAAEKGRYHLYVSYACPWAHRVIIMRELKRLKNVISLSSVEPYMGEFGWSFGPDKDPLYKKNYLSEIYTLSTENYTGRVTVPILWDKQSKKIVNNESSDLMKMLNSSFNEFADESIDLYPDALQNEIDEINEFIYHNVNNGVYKVGFATAQSVYNDEVSKLFYAIDKLERVLSKQRYLVGPAMTIADIRLFTTLIRFDSVYVGHFKCNLRRLIDYTNLSNYLRDIYQTKTISNTVRILDIKTHYYTSHPTINPNQIVPMGPTIDLSASHNRSQLD